MTTLPDVAGRGRGGDHIPSASDAPARRRARRRGGPCRRRDRRSSPPPPPPRRWAAWRSARAQPGEQLADPERLVDVVVGAEVESGDLLALAVPRREDDDRRLRPFADGADHFLAVEVGQAEVEQDQIRPPGRRRPDRRRAGVDAFDLVTGGDQGGLQKAVDLGLVVDDEDNGRPSSHRSFLRIRGVRAAPADGRSSGYRGRPAIGLSAVIDPPIAVTTPRQMERPSPVPRGAAVAARHAVELLEHPFELVGGNAPPRVLDLDPRRAPLPAEAHPHLGVAGRELDRIVEEVETAPARAASRCPRARRACPRRRGRSGAPGGTGRPGLRHPRTTSARSTQSVASSKLPVSSRVMSRRLATNWPSRRVSSSIAERRSLRVAGSRRSPKSFRLVTDPRIEASGVRRSCEIEESSAERRRSLSTLAAASFARVPSWDALDRDRGLVDEGDEKAFGVLGERRVGVRSARNRRRRPCRSPSPTAGTASRHWAGSANGGRPAPRARRPSAPRPVR